MTDRELLELAAKAAGFPKEWRGSIRAQTDHGPRWWGPREGDGDALRLAAKVAQQINWVMAPDGFGGHVSVVYQDTGSMRSGVIEAFSGCCARSATRLAIFRAAVEVGKAMP